MKKQTTRKIEENVILTLAQQDYAEFQKGQKSYKLYNWLKTELIISNEENENKLLFSVKSLGRIVNILGMLRERNLEKCDVQILDRETAELSFKFDTTTLSNAEIYMLNQQYGLTIPENEKVEQDVEFAHR